MSSDLFNLSLAIRFCSDTAGLHHEILRGDIDTLVPDISGNGDTVLHILVFISINNNNKGL